MKRIIVFLSGVLVLGSAAVVWGWSNGHGLMVPRADLNSSAHATPVPAKASPATPARHLTPRPTPALTPRAAPSASPVFPSATPSPSFTLTPAPTVTPVPTGGCGTCGGTKHSNQICPQYCVN